MCMPPGYRLASSVQHRGTCTTSPALQLRRISAYALPTSARDCRRHPTGAMQLVEPPGSIVARVGRRTGGCPLLRHCAGHCGPRRRRRIMDAQKVEPVAHHSCFSAEHPVGSAGVAFAPNAPLQVAATVTVVVFALIIVLVVGFRPPDVLWQLPSEFPRGP